MVVFTCNICGESLKKNKVEKHFKLQCRNPIDVSCMDCCKDFRGNEYQAHTKCITEDEKYSGKDFVPKPSTNKGERKQQEWLDIVRSFQHTEDIKFGAEERNLLDTMGQYDNVPRKKKQFKNFISNIFHSKISPSTVENVWKMLDEKLKSIKPNCDDTENSTINTGKENEDISPNVKEQPNEDQTEEKLTRKEKKKKHKREKYEQQLKEIENKSTEEIETQNVDLKPKKKKKSKKITKDKEDVETVEQTDANNLNKKSKKRSLEEKEGLESPIKKKRKDKELEPDATAEENGNLEVDIKPQKFNWEEMILKALTPKGELPIKRLRKKVLNEYQNIGYGGEISKEKAVAKFNKKLLKVVGVRVTKEVATLIL